MNRGESMAHLDDTVAGVKGIGPKKQKLLAGMGIHTLRDVLTLYPFRYDDWSELAPVREWRGRDTAVFVGRVTHLDVSNTSRRNVKVVKAVLEGAQGEIVATWFGRYQMEKYLYPGVQLLVFGRVSANYSMELNVQEHQFIKNEAQLRRLLVVHPVYSLTEGIGKVDMLHLSDAALAAVDELDEPLTPEQAARYDLLGYRDAVRRIHRPQSMADAERAYHDLVVYEFLAMTLWGQRARNSVQTGIAHSEPPLLADAFVAALPYELTGAQKLSLIHI